MRGIVVRWFAVLVIAVLAFAAWRIGTRQEPASRPTVSKATPAAAGEVLVLSPSIIGTVHPASKYAVLTGRTSGVRLLGYGFVSGYRSGAVTHAAPSGQRLLAFRMASVAGEAGQGVPKVSLRIDSAVRGPLAVTTDYVVASIPLTASQVDLTLDDGGVQQSLSLLDGRPASTNLAVCERIHLRAVIGSTRSVSVQVRSAAGSTGLTSGLFTLRSVSLSYWAADGSHPSSAQRALLHIQASVRLSGDTVGYGAEPGLLSVMVPGDNEQPVHNAASNPTASVDAVVEVPASITDGTVSYSGTMKTAAGTITVLTPISIPFGIPAG